MPQKRKYRCLNPNCIVSLFVAMNAPTPACPRCGAIKVENGGETTYDLGYCQASNGIVRAETRRIRQSDERAFRAIADDYGLTNMSNKDGKAITGASREHGGATVKYAGFDVPLSAAANPRGACINIPEGAQKLNLQGATRMKADGRPGLREMTNIVGRHKAP